MEGTAPQPRQRMDAPAQPRQRMEGYGQWAEHYRRALWVSVLPLPPRAKTPPPGGYTGRKADKIPDDQQIAEWVRTRPGGNLCLRMPGDVIGIDVDDYEYTYHARDDDNNLLYLPDGAADMRIGVKTGNVTLGGLEDELGPLPATWRSSSRGDGPSGIRFYRVPSGLLWGDFGEHLECIWWGHRYAVVWPSVNPDSNMRYLWIDDREGDDAEWGAPPPKVTDLPDLPESWVARFGRAADTPRLPAPVAARPQTPATPVAAADPDRPHQFTREQAERYVDNEGLAPLRAATEGSINNRLNDAATVLGHFVPHFWSHGQAVAALMAALRHTTYDDTRSALASIESGLNAPPTWVAELVSEPVRPPGGARTRPRDGQDDGWPTEAPDAPAPDTAGFWDARPELAYLRDFALSRYAAPWAVLGATLARAVSCVEPNFQLPAVIGTEASLNLFVGLVGQSGGGKDIATGVSEALLLPVDGRDPVPLDVIPLGSGEGLSHIYMKRPPKLTKRKKADDDSEAIGLGFNPESDQPIQYRTRALVSVAEIDTLGSLSERRGSTVGGQLRQAWSGSQLGFQYVDPEKRMIVPKHSYRMCLVAGVQPGRAGTLLGETDGGTPQRFLWLPAQANHEDPTDEQIDNPPPPLEGTPWTPPRYGGRVLLEVCPTARRTIVRAHIARGRGEGDALDGHSLLNRLKTAAALAMLCHSGDPRRQCEIAEQDWELAGAILAMSDHTREGVRRVLAEQTRLENERKAIAEAHKAIVVTERVEDDGLKKTTRWLRGKIVEEWTTEQALRSKIKGSQKKHLADALAALAAAGEIEIGEYEANNGTARRVRRTPPPEGLGD